MKKLLITHMILALLFVAGILNLSSCSAPVEPTYLDLELTASTPRSTQYFDFGTGDYDLKVDNKGLVVRQPDGSMLPIQPIMGEIHLARVARADWSRELDKMKEGGINTISCYLFWTHHEPTEGNFDWSDNRDVRSFVELCGQKGLYVVLRIGPWCHGECYLGGLPEWVVADTKVKVRSLDPKFMRWVGRFYREVGQQVQDLYGCTPERPIIAVQIENECGGDRWPYMMALKDSALAAGIVPPMFTRTGWPAVKNATFGEMLPLYGDYADGFWSRGMEDMPGGYPDAFTFRESRLSNVIATEVFGTDQSRQMQQSDLSYPYFTCELGGGMMPSYARRVRIFDRDAVAMAVCKVGSGSNMPGYYMYHGGTNPYNPEHSMAEMTESPVTNYNDLPYMSYDFQAPLGEMGQRNGSYYELRRLHSFLQNWGAELSDWDAIFPATNCEEGRKDSLLRYTVRTDGMRGFVFINNYTRMMPMSAKENLQWRLHRTDGSTLIWPSRPITIQDSVVCWMPFGLDLHGLTLDYATAMPYDVQTDGVTMTYLFAAIPGVPVEVSIEGKLHKLKVNDKLKMLNAEGRTVCIEIRDDQRSQEPRYPLSEVAGASAKATQVCEAKGLREMRIVPLGIPAQPHEPEFDQAALWNIELQGIDSACVETAVLEVCYKGDVARLYADGQLVEDNFWNGRPMLVRLRDIIGKHLELKILPLGKEYPIYLQPAEREVLAACDSMLLELDGLRVVNE